MREIKIRTDYELKKEINTIRWIYIISAIFYLIFISATLLSLWGGFYTLGIFTFVLAFVYSEASNEARSTAYHSIELLEIRRLLK